MTTQHKKAAMNLAIDRLLDEQEQVALDEHLDRTPEDAHLWERMKRADRMLRTAPKIGAPHGFAERMMLALAAGSRPQMDKRLGLGMALGLLLTAFTAIPLLGIALIGLLWVVTNGAALGLLAARVQIGIAALVNLAGLLLQQVSATYASSPLTLALTLAIIPVILGWLWAVRTFATPGEQVTYRIPVRIAG